MTTPWPARRKAFAAWLPMYPAPPVTRTVVFGSVAANGVIREAVLLHLSRGEQVPPVEHDRAAHQRLHAVEVRPPEFVPLGHDRQAIGVLQRIVVGGQVLDAFAKDAFCDLGRFGIV